MVAGAVAAALLAAAGLVSGCVARSVPPAPRVVTGEWGGMHVALHLRAGGGTIEYDCAGGTLDAPLATAGDGGFVVAGSHVRGHGGPARAGEVPQSEPATYSGNVDGDRMTLVVHAASATLGPFVLHRDAPARLTRCL